MVEEISKIGPLRPAIQTARDSTATQEEEPQSAHTAIVMEPATSVANREAQGQERARIIPGPWVAPSPSRTLSGEVGRLVRNPFAKTILSELEWISRNQEPGTPTSAPRIARILRVIRDYTLRYHDDPFASFLNALYDGLAAENSWIRIPREDYRAIEAITRKLASISISDFRLVDKAIATLEGLGLDTTPYVLEDEEHQ